MREVTKEMIEIFGLKELGYDMAGYTFNRTQDLSFHHTIVARRNCKSQGLGDGYYFWNGSILVQKTSHEEIHRLEIFKPQDFAYLTSELIDMNISREIKIENLKRIREILLEFEYQYRNYITKSGHPLIKKEYTTNRIKL